MPRIQWSGLPPALGDHRFDRLRDRTITAEDLYQLKAFRESNPEAPEGLWYTDFGSFKICWRREVSEDVFARATRRERAEILTGSGPDHRRSVCARQMADEASMTRFDEGVSADKWLTIGGGSRWFGVVTNSRKH